MRRIIVSLLTSLILFSSVHPTQAATPSSVQKQWSYTMTSGMDFINNVEVNNSGYVAVDYCNTYGEDVGEMVFSNSLVLFDNKGKSKFTYKTKKNTTIDKSFLSNDGYVYITEYDDSTKKTVLKALNINGTVRWFASLRDRNGIFESAENGKIYVSSGNYLYAIDSKNGKVTWTYPLPSYTSVKMTGNDGAAIFYKDKFDIVRKGKRISSTPFPKGFKFDDYYYYKKNSSTGMLAVPLIGNKENLIAVYSLDGKLLYQYKVTSLPNWFLFNKKNELLAYSLYSKPSYKPSYLWLDSKGKKISSFSSVGEAFYVTENRNVYSIAHSYPPNGGPSKNTIYKIDAAGTKKGEFITKDYINAVNPFGIITSSYSERGTTLNFYKLM